MYNAKAYSAASETSPLAPTAIARRDPTEHDVQIEILFCGICHSDLHTVRNEWSEFMSTVYPIVPGHEIVGRVTQVGSAVTKYKPADLAAVGCLVDSDRTCARCKAGLENFCPNLTLTFGSPDKRLGGVTYGGYSESVVVDERFVMRVPSNLDLAGAAPRLCAGITTYSPLRHWGVGEGKKVGVVGVGGLGHMGVKFARAFGAHVVVFTTSPDKKEDALRLGAHEIVVSRNADEMQKHAGSFDFILDTVSAEHDVNSYLNLLDIALPVSARPRSRCPSRHSRSLWETAVSAARTSAASPRHRRCSTSAANTTSQPTSRSSPFRKSTKPTKDCSSPM
jgi:alcohol dehydrogenase (NADP+)